MLYVYIAGSVVCTVYGQLIVKWRIGRYGVFPPGLSDKFHFLLQVLMDPFIISGLAAAFVSALFWIAAMTTADVSFAYPFISAGLILLTVSLAVLLLGEPMTMLKAAGIAMIIMGVLTMAAQRGSVR